MNKTYPILLPQTKFPMKGNLPQTEPRWIQLWKEKNIYGQIQKKYQKNKELHLLDGPPYANGPIHLGTALNKVLKDILVKQAWLRGFKCSFVPLWDCHGLPIELRALKKIKSREPKDIRSACRKEAYKWIQVQEEQFQRLGVLADWENKILTMQSFFEAEEVRALSRLVEKGLLYRGKRPIHWCMKLQTATAVSEVEYQNRKSPSIDVKFLANTDKFPKNSYFVIWTTTPWTLPANQAICVHPDFEYGLYENTEQKEFLLMALELKPAFEKRSSLKLKLKEKFKGRKLEGLKYSHPFMNRISPIILGSHVTLETGTGCVHTAPGHGIEDFTVGQKYNLPLTCPVDEKGCFTSEIPEWKDLNVFKSNPLIIEKLKSSGHLSCEEEIEHSYPFNPRSKFPLIFRVTDQWFLQFDHKDINIRETALKSLEQIQFVPSWSKSRLKAMIQDSPDWCLSRQRIWGVPLPVFYCASCKAPLLSSKLMQKLADQMEKTKEGIEYYFSRSAKELIGQTACKKCSHTHFKKGEDILDVWFDSGLCHWVFKKLKNVFPVDVYIEGSDQHRGWFQTSLNSSIALHQKSPFKTLVTHGFVYDMEKRKMSKSLGNIISPEEITKKYGAEILRLWTASSDYSGDISTSEEILSRIRETYRRFRNTIRFLIGNLHDFSVEKNSVPLSKMKELDQWILTVLTELSEEILMYYEKFEFHRVYQSLNKFFTNELSSVYLDIIKDRLYTFKKDSLERRSSQTALDLLLKNLLPLMSPITSFLCEEAYQHLNPQKESIFLEPFNKLSFKNKELSKKFEKLLEIRKKVSKELETLRKEKVLGSSLSACVHLTLPDESYKICSQYPDLEELLIVSEVQIAKGEFKINIQKASGDKCIRCWYYSKKLNAESLCPKCVKNL